MIPLSRAFFLSSLSLAGCASASPPAAAPAAVAAVGQPAPDFSLKGLDGKTFSLKEHAGKVVVLEWFNPGCPFVRYAHGEGPLKDQGNQAQDRGIVWVAINSGAPGRQGHGLEVNQKATAEWGMRYPVLLDESGTVGQMYGAKTTPHMYVIDGKGTLAYAGALDNAPRGEAEGGTAVNFVAEALAQVSAGQRVQRPTTKPYGCSVKYGG